MKRFIYILLAVLFSTISCDDQLGGTGKGKIQVTDLTFEASLSTPTPIVYNEGKLILELKTNRSKIKILSVVSEYNFPEIVPGQEYEINKSLSFTSEKVAVTEDGQGSAILTVYDEKTEETKELTLEYKKTTEFEIKPTSIAVSKNNFSISMDEELEIEYTVNPVQAHANIGIKRIDMYDSDIKYDVDHENRKIKLTGGNNGGKAQFKVYSVADTNVCSYIDMYVKHRVAIELDIKSIGNESEEESLFVFWVAMPVHAKTRLVKWEGDLTNSPSHEIKIKEFTLPTEYKATFYVNISTGQTKLESRYFFGGDVSPDSTEDAKKWNTNIQYDTGARQYSQWGESHTGPTWSRFSWVQKYYRYSTYKTAKNQMDELTTNQPGYRELPVLLNALQENNAYRWVSKKAHGYADSKFQVGWWMYNPWTVYYITVEDIVYDKSKLDLEYIFHKYRMRNANGGHESGTYYWAEADKQDWAEKVNDK